MIFVNTIENIFTGEIMKIIIVGCGNVGKTLTEQLSQEGHNIVVIDTKPELVQAVTDSYDVLGIVGNGTSYHVLSEAGIDSADLLIAVAGSDELNLLCCVMAKKAGNCQLIARVSNPVYRDELEYIRKELGISMIVNPELAVANEVARLIKYPSAIGVSSFAKDRIELMKIQVTKSSTLCDCHLRSLKSKIGLRVLVGMVERDEEIIIPNGDFLIQENDYIYVVTPAKEAITFLQKIGLYTNKVHTVMIVGGGQAMTYLAEQLCSVGIQVKIIERNPKRCDELCELLPQAVIINGDGTDRDLLFEEEIEQSGAFIAWTNIDEENIMLSLYVKSVSNAKLVTNIHRVNYDNIIKTLDLGSVIYPKKITAEYIICYVRGMQNSFGSNVETLYRLVDNRVEALEFIAKEDAKDILNIPLSQLKTKPNVLILSIRHRGNVIIPRGNDVIQVGDSVVVLTTLVGLREMSDILL